MKKTTALMLMLERLFSSFCEMDGRKMKKEYNAGIGLLRALMSFLVVLIHCWDVPENAGVLNVFVYAKGFAVPVFMMISFMLSRQLLLERGKDRLVRRYERLIIPLVGWAVIYWVVDNALEYVIGSKNYIGLSDLVWQIFTGHSPRINTAMWFQVDLILLTTLFLILLIVFKDNGNAAIWILFAVAVIFQYSGLIKIFDGFNYELKYPYERIVEVIPVAVIGFMMAANNILDRLKRHAKLVFGLSGLILLVDYFYGFFIEVPGDDYMGIRMLVIPVAFVMLFYVMPFDMLSDKQIKVIKWMTQGTVGVYCMHQLVSSIINRGLAKFAPSVITRTFTECIVIYLICFICAIIGKKLFGKTKLKALFD